jgi:hypothetical protein
MEAQKSESPAEQAVDPDRLLDGEDPDTAHLEDAEHWLSVYADLLKSKQELIGVTEHRMEHIAADAAVELGQTDLEILETESRRFERRIAFWQSRVRDLAGPERG